MTRNGKIRLEDRHFNWESDVKEEYLHDYEKTKSASTIRTIKGKLLKIDEYETLMNKSVYNLNLEEIDDLMSSQFSIKSRNAASGNMSYIIRYIDFCIKKNLVKHRENRFKIVSKEDKYKYVSLHAQKNKYLSKEEILEAQDKLKNPCDKLILELIPLGVRGRTQQGNTNEELRNLRNDDVDFENRKLTLRNNDGEERYIYDLSDHTLNLLKETINQKTYKTKKSRKIKKDSDDTNSNSDSKLMTINRTDYIFRTAGKNKHGKVKVQYFGSRLNQIIKEHVGNSYINVTNLYFSGMIEYAKQLLEAKNGEPLDNLDYSKICDKFNYGEPIQMKNGEVSWGNVISKVKILVEDYFEANKSKEKKA